VHACLTERVFPRQASVTSASACVRGLSG